MANKYCKECSCEGYKVPVGSSGIGKVDSSGRVYRSYVCDDCAVGILEVSLEDYRGE